jgi:Lrp/AsnC family leucine-responsive transcriptional regulator
MKIDRTDLEIVKLLQKDGRMSHEQISKELHLSRPAIHERIRRMEAAGVIRGYTTKVDWEALGLSVGAYIFVRVTGDSLVVAHQILKFQDEDAMVEECHRVAGDWCLLVQTRSASTVALQRLMDDLRSIPGVTSTMTTITLSTVLPDEGSTSARVATGQTL